MKNNQGVTIDSLVPSRYSPCTAGVPAVHFSGDILCIFLIPTKKEDSESAHKPYSRTHSQGSLADVKSNFFCTLCKNARVSQLVMGEQWSYSRPKRGWPLDVFPHGTGCACCSVVTHNIGAQHACLRQESMGLNVNIIYLLSLRPSCQANKSAVISNSCRAQCLTDFAFVVLTRSLGRIQTHSV